MGDDVLERYARRFFVQILGDKLDQGYLRAVHVTVAPIEPTPDLRMPGCMAAARVAASDAEIKGLLVEQDQEKEKEKAVTSRWNI